MDSLHIQRFRAVLARLLVTVGVVLLLGALIPLPALAGNLGAASPAQAHIHLPKSPLSGSVLVARAIHSGKLQSMGASAGTTSGSSTPTCSPTPCALSNVQTSQGKKPVNEDPIASNPTNAQDLLTGGNYYYCSWLM